MTRVITQPQLMASAACGYRGNQFSDWCRQKVRGRGPDNHSRGGGRRRGVSRRRCTVRPIRPHNIRPYSSRRRRSARSSLRRWPALGGPTRRPRPPTPPRFLVHWDSSHHPSAPAITPTAPAPPFSPGLQGTIFGLFMGGSGQPIPPASLMDRESSPTSTRASPV